MCASIYKYYSPDLAGTTRLFGGINPETEIRAYVNLHGQANVLEIGCGKGLTLRDLENVPHVRFFGTTVVSEPEFRTIKATVKICHAGQIAKKFAEQMDFVFADSSVTHSATIFEGLREISKIMKPNSRLLVNFGETVGTGKEIESWFHKLGFNVLKITFVREQAWNRIFEISVPFYLYAYYAEKLSPAPPKN